MGNRKGTDMADKKLDDINLEQQDTGGEVLTASGLDAFVSSLPNRKIPVVETWTYPLWQQMIHLVNHTTQHRSEVAAVLTRLGRSPGWLDFLLYVDEQQG